MKNLAILVLFPILCAAAEAPPVDAVIELARGVPGEFAADALIRLASLNSLDKNRRTELLEQAFRRASEAQEPLKREAVNLKIPGAAGFLNRAFSQDLDGLSLRLRAIEAMEPLDPAKARALLQQIPPVQVPKLTCADFMAYNVAGYYQTLARLAPPRQVLKQVGAIRSPVEVALAAKATLGAAKDSDFQAQVTAFTQAIARISGDDRAFTFVRDAGPQILELVEECRRRKISPLPLLESYRVYLVHNEQTARCADDDVMNPSGEQKIALDTGAPMIGGEGVAFFNTRLRVSPIQPIQEQETTPTSLEGVAEGLRACQDTLCQALAEGYKDLIFDSQTHTPYPTVRKTTPEWQEQVRKFLAVLAGSHPASAVTPAQYFRLVSSLYADTLSLVPPGPMQEEVAAAMQAFVETSDFQKESHIEWFLPINILIGRMALDPLGIGRFAGHLRQSKNPVIALYAALEAVAPRSPGEIMALQ
jgi:hypothetical protein